MFNFLKVKKSELTIRLDRPDGIYYQGETVNVTVDIQPKRALELAGIRVILKGSEGIKVTSSGSFDPMEGPSTWWEYHEFFTSEEKRFIDETTVAGGELQHYSFQVHVPSEARPSFVSQNRLIRWQVIAKLMGRYFEKEMLSEAELIVQVSVPGDQRIAGQT